MAIAGAALSVGMAGYQIYNAEQQKKEAKNALDDFVQQELTNPFADLTVSTLAADQQTEANLSRYATSVDALQRGGARGMSQLSQLNDTNVFLQNMISADLDKQDKQRQILQAQGEEKITALQEQREQSALLGLGQQYQTARQDSSSGLMNLMGGAMTLGTSIQQKIDDDNGIPRPQVITGNTLQPTAPRLASQPSYDPYSIFQDTNSLYGNNSIFDYNNPFA